MKLKLGIAVMLFCFLMGCQPTFQRDSDADFPNEKIKIGILMKDQKETQTISDSFIDTLLASGIDSQRLQFEVEILNSGTTQIIDEWIEHHVDMVYCIGAYATSIASRKLSHTQIPLIFTGYQDDVNFSYIEEDNFKGVYSDIGIDQTLQWMRSLMPQLKVVGVAYQDLQSSKDLVKEIEEVAKTMGIEVLNADDEYFKKAAQHQLTPYRIPDAFLKIDEADLSFLKRDDDKYALPIFALNEDVADESCVAYQTADLKGLGNQAGKMALRLLLYNVEMDDLENEYPKERNVIYSEELMRDFGLKIRKE